MPLDLMNDSHHGAKVAIVGSGIIGLSFAIVFARAGCRVTIFLRDSQQEASLRQRALDLLDTSRLLLKESPEVVLGRIQVTDDLAQACHGADYVQESLPERLDVKKAIFSHLDQVTAHEAIIASSSSGLPISMIADGLAGAHRCLIAHPGTPPHLLPVVEIVPSPVTQADVTQSVMALMRKVGMKPVHLMKEQKGFVLNRLQVALVKEMLNAVRDEVISVEDADSLIRDGFGLRWAVVGPLAGIDMNAPGGISDYLTRYAALYQSEAGTTPLSPAVLQALDKSLRDRYPLTRHAERIAQRDLGIARIRAGREDL